MLKIRLAEIAAAKGYSQKDIHFGTKLSYPTIYRYWLSTAEQIDLKVLGVFCDFLDCDPGDLIKRTTSPA